MEIGRLTRRVRPVVEAAHLAAEEARPVVEASHLAAEVPRLAGETAHLMVETALSDGVLVSAKALVTASAAALASGALAMDRGPWTGALRGEIMVAEVSR